MFENILDCPVCGKRFHYGYDGEEFPSSILCPECGESRPSGEFTVLALCSECHAKLKIPLAILHETGNTCPKCGAEIHPARSSMEENQDSFQTVQKSEEKRILQDGDFFDKFKIISLLGKGGMAEVYLAEHLLLKQLYALKLMQKSLDNDKDPIFVKRFIREAKMTHSLNHPNIVQVFDAGSDFKTGHLFLAMEYIEGTTLHDLIYKKVLSEKELLEILAVMSDALKALEKAKIVHRDIKPSNIMYSAEGIFKLMDLGIAKMENDHSKGDMTLTMEQSAIGTPGYASPEQCRSAHRTDIRSDIFSLGATIYHAATRNIPFTGETPVEVILNTAQSEPPPLRSCRDDLSEDFISLVEKMMKKKPSERFQNIEELQQAIEKTARPRQEKTSVKTWSRNAAALVTTSFSNNESKGTRFRKFIPAVLSLLVFLAAVSAAVYFTGPGRKSSSSDRQSSPAKAVSSGVLQKKAPPAPALQSGTALAAANPPKSVKVSFYPLAPYTKEKLSEGSVSTLENSLERSRRNCARLAASAALWRKSLDTTPPHLLPCRREIVEKAEALVGKWQKRIISLEKRNRKIRAVKVRRYDALETQKVRDAVNRCFVQRKERNFTQKLFEMLKNEKVDPNLVVNNPYHDILCGPILNPVVRHAFRKPEDLIKLLAERGASPEAITFRQWPGGCPNHIMIRYGLPEEVTDATFAHILHRSRHTQDQLDLLELLFMDGASPTEEQLSKVVRTGNYSKTLFLLACGTDPNRLDSKGQTAFFSAYLQPEGEKFRALLLAAGADPGIKSPVGLTASDMAPIAEFIKKWQQRDLAAVRQALKSKLIPPDHQLWDDHTLLTSSCLKLDRELIELLLEAGANPNKRSFRNGFSPIGSVMSNCKKQNAKQCAELVLLLLSHGANLKHIHHNTARKIFCDFPDKEELLPRLVKYASQLPEKHWGAVFSFFGRPEKKGGFSSRSKLLLIEHCPGHILKKYIVSLCLRRVRLTPAILQKALSAGLDCRRPPKRGTKIRPLLLYLLASKQSPAVIETALKAGADPKWKDEKNRPLSRWTRDRKVRQLLEKYSRKP